MRIVIYAILILPLLASVVRADEKLPVLKVGGDTYSNVVITSVSATDIFFTSDQGMGNVKLKNLDPELQKHFHYNAGMAAQTMQRLADANIRYHFRVAAAANAPVSPADVKVELADAIARVREIVNQPVRHLAPQPGMLVATYRPGWFHPGAIRPDFNKVDVRATQDLVYAKDQYVTSDLTPGVVFLGAELEFNSMTKCFYTDRSLPKKKLTEAEMLEINRLYRVIGADESRMSQPSN